MTILDVEYFFMLAGVLAVTLGGCWAVEMWARKTWPNKYEETYPESKEGEDL